MDATRPEPLILGVVLAGGASRRMGRDKATLEIEGETFLERVLARLGEVSDGLAVAGREVPEVPSFPDPVTGRRGPLAGLVGAYRHLADRPIAEAPWILLVAVDQPDLRPDTLRRIVALADPHHPAAVVPVDEVPQVTCALYPPSWADAAEAELAAGGSLASLVRRLDTHLVPPTTWRTWGEDGRSWRSIDTPEAYARRAAEQR